MAVSVIEKTSGTASSASGVTVSFPSAVNGDLILFTYATYIHPFEDYDWHPTTGWQGTSTSFTHLGGWIGFYTHIVSGSETSWTPVTDAGNISGIWIAYRIQGHSKANPILNDFLYNKGINYPNTAPGSDAAKGMFFTNNVIPSGTGVVLSDGITGGASWHVDTQVDGSGNNYAVGYVAAPDNITTATGTWAGVFPENSAFQWVVQAAPVAASGPDGSYIIKEEVVQSIFSGITAPDIGFNISWTPTPGNILLAIFCAASTYPSGSLTPQANWTIRENSKDIPSLAGGMVLATRTVQMSDGTNYIVSTTGGGDAWYAYVFEIAGTSYSGAAIQDQIMSPFYPTPFEGGVGQTLCFFPITIGQNVTASYSEYAMTSGQTPDGSGVWSVNEGGSGEKFISVVSHMITTGGGTADTGVPTTTNEGVGLTAVFNITAGPSTECAITDPLNFTGDVSGHFYTMQGMGSEVVPCLYEDAVITIDNGTMSPAGQTIATDGEWIRWLPNSGPLSIPFSPRTLWVVTNQAKNSPPVVAVWASTQVFPIWKQTCTVS